MSFIDTLIEKDQEFFLLLNGMHSSFMDPIMWWVSDMLIWVPFYALLLFLLLRQESKKFTTFDWKTVAFVVVAIALTITIADQIASGFCKPFFARFRPSHEPALEGLVHLLKNTNGDFYKGGKYGFVSSHSANSFALAMFLFQLFKPGKYAWMLFVWAFVVAYSRIYLGVHYLGDILGGGFIGLFAGWVGSKLYLFLKHKFILKT